MAPVATSGRVIARNNIGRFITECEMAATATVKDMIAEGEQISRGLAPVGSRPDPRHIPIHAAFFTRMYSRTSGVWGNFSEHALHQEYGTRPHMIVGNPYVTFFWENAGRMWVPGLFGTPDVINHPGHDAQPFLRPAYKTVTARAMAIARRYYPGGRV